jgi:DNA-binding transcriptional LysR family regulator
MVLGDETEIGLARSLQHPEVETISLRDDPLLLVTKGGKGGKFTRRARLEDVANWPLISFERGSSDWTLTQSLFRRAGLVANIAFEVDSIEIAKRMVERGLGFAFLPQLAVATELRSGHMVAVKILDAEPLGRSLDLIHARRHPLRPEALAFLQAVREEAASGVSPFGPGSTRIRKRLGR